MKIEKYQITTGQGQGEFERTRAIWGVCGNVISPLIYFRKPKWMSEKAFLQILAHLELKMPQTIEIEEEK